MNPQGRKIDVRPPSRLPSGSLDESKLPARVPTLVDIINRFYEGSNMFTKIFNWIVARLSEGTTWGAAALLTALGLNLDEANAVIAAVVSLLAAIRIFLPEKRGDAAPAEG